MNSSACAICTPSAPSPRPAASAALPESLFRASSAVARSVAGAGRAARRAAVRAQGQRHAADRGRRAGAAARRPHRGRAARGARRRAARCATSNGGRKVGGIEALAERAAPAGRGAAGRGAPHADVAHAMGTSQSAVSQAIARWKTCSGSRCSCAPRTACCRPTPAGAGSNASNASWPNCATFRKISPRWRAWCEGVVTIGALPLARSQLLPLAIAAVLQRHPRLQSVRSKVLMTN
jgi:LysR family transcriptional regulator of gallate degradation